MKTQLKKDEQVILETRPHWLTLAGQKQTNTTDISSELERLYELKQKGILTEEEYQMRKIRILNS